MMKIHTTQNLNSLGRMQSTNSNTIPNDEIRLNYSGFMRKQSLKNDADVMQDTVSFGRGNKKLLNTAAKQAKKTFGERVANTKGYKKLQNSGSFSKVLETTSKQEVMIQAGTALGICCFLRPAAIFALPSKKNKKDNAYAATHSISSGIWGFVVPFTCIKPVAAGYNYALKNAGKYIKEDATLKKFWPHLDLKTVRDAVGNRTEMSNWLDVNKNKFIPDVKDIRKVPKPKHLSEFSDEALKKICPDLNISKAKGSPINEWVDNNGQKIKSNNFEFKDMFIAVEDSYNKGNKVMTNTKYYPLMHVKEDILKEMYPELNTEALKGTDGKRLTPDKWIKNDGSKFELPVDNIFISTWEKDTEKCIPLITGEVRKDGKEIKDVCYQKNNNENDPYSLGTAVTKEMTDADRVNSVLNKLGGWLPDIVVAYPRATATIALIPFILKNVLGMEKSKKEPEKQEVADAFKDKLNPEVNKVSKEVA